jgi:hypothetical protein
MQIVTALMAPHNSQNGTDSLGLLCILAEGAIALSVTPSGDALFAS